MKNAQHKSFPRTTTVLLCLATQACTGYIGSSDQDVDLSIGAGAAVPQTHEIRDAVQSYLGQRFFHQEGGQTYTTFVPIPEGQSTYQDNWRKQARNHPHESLVSLALADLGRCAEAKSMLWTFAQQQSDQGGYRYDTRFDRGPWDNRGVTSAPLLAVEAIEVFNKCGADDVEFLRGMYYSLVRNKVWWDQSSNRRFANEPGKACNGFWHWNDAIESIRDSLPEAGFPHVPTWEATDGPQNQCATDLNFYIVATYRAMAEMEPIVGANDGFEAIADQAAAALRDAMWDPESSFFYGIDRRTNSKVMIKDIGGWLALYAGVATQEQAEAMVATHLRPVDGAFHTDFGIPSLDRYDSHFGSNRHWSGGFWPGLSLLVVRGLKDYGFDAEARRVAGPFLSEVVTSTRDGIPLPEWYDSEEGNMYDLFCEVGDEFHPENAKVNCNYITSSLALPMAVELQR